MGAFCYLKCIFLLVFIDLYVHCNIYTTDLLTRAYSQGDWGSMFRFHIGKSFAVFGFFFDFSVSELFFLRSNWLLNPACRTTDVDHILSRGKQLFKNLCHRSIREKNLPPFHSCIFSIPWLNTRNDVCWLQTSHARVIVMCWLLACTFYYMNLQ